MIRPPEGFVVHAGPRGPVVLVREIADAALAAGVACPWELVRPRPAGPGTGRGAVGFVATAAGPLLVKEHRRGGVLARVNRDRYFGRRRFLRELEVGRAARAAGLPVGEAVGVAFARACPGWKAWGIVRAIDDAQDLARWLHEPDDQRRARELWTLALTLAEQLHDGGLEHADLNVGNILARPRAGTWELFAVDLDRARWWGRPLSADRRARVHRRLARSWRKVFGCAPPA